MASTAASRREKFSDHNTNCSDKFTPTEYTNHFDTSLQNGYFRKLSELNMCDPYAVPQRVFKPLTTAALDLDLPDFQCGDLYNYLIHFPSKCTGSSLKAFKVSLDSSTVLVA